MQLFQQTSRQIKTKLPVLAAAVLLGFGGLLALPATALGANNMLFVGHGAIGNGKNCNSPGFNSVQAAVDAAAPGNTVYLCGAQFPEQVFVNKSITLSGDNGSGLTAAGTTFAASASRYPAKFTTDNLFLPQALLVTEGAQATVKVNGLKFSGLLPGNGGCAEQEFGVLALAGKLDMTNDKVLSIADSNSSLLGCQFGVGIQVGREYWPKAADFSSAKENFSASADLNDVTVSGYQKNGVTVDGSGSSAIITGSTVTGAGRVSYTAQNGIQISRGASGKLSTNTVSNNDYTGNGFAASTGILVFGGLGDPLVTNTSVVGNHLVNNDEGVALNNYNSDGSGPAATPTRNTASLNLISDSAVTNVSGLCDGSAACGGQLIGYQAGISDVGNRDTITGNLMSGAGYAPQGNYNFSVTPPVFTQAGPNPAVVRHIDAGTTFPTTDPTLFANL